MTAPCLSAFSTFNPFVVIVLVKLGFNTQLQKRSQHVCDKGCRLCVSHESDLNTYGALMSQITGSGCRWTRARVCMNTRAHAQNKHSNPGLEKLSDDTAACIMAKTFTLLFFHNPFIFLLSSLFILAFVCPFVTGTSLAGDVLIADGGGGTHCKGNRSQGHSRQGYLYARDEES